MLTRCWRCPYLLLIAAFESSGKRKDKKKERDSVIATVSRTISNIRCCFTTDVRNGAGLAALKAASAVPLETLKPPCDSGQPADSASRLKILRLPRRHCKRLNSNPRIHITAAPTPRSRMFIKLSLHKKQQHKTLLPPTPLFTSLRSAQSATEQWRALPVTRISIWLNSEAPCSERRSREGGAHVWVDKSTWHSSGFGSKSPVWSVAHKNRDCAANARRRPGKTWMIRQPFYMGKSKSGRSESWNHLRVVSPDACVPYRLFDKTWDFTMKRQHPVILKSDFHDFLIKWYQMRCIHVTSTSLWQVWKDCVWGSRIKRKTGENVGKLQTVPFADLSNINS